MASRFNFPHLGFGLGLRAPHYETVLDERPKTVDWFEIISENFIDAHCGLWDFLADLRRDYPFVMHGVALSIGSTDPLDRVYLKKLRMLVEFLQPAWVSDHLCWTGVNGKNTHDLLPIPYTKETLALVVDRIKHVQDFLGRPLLLENPSTYLEFASSSMPEAEFIAHMAELADCALLLDVNNIYVNAYNHGGNARAALETLPADRIAQIHLAGHTNCGTHIIDTHDDTVIDPVWDLYAHAIRTKGFTPTMIERDGAIPPFADLVTELDKARAVANDAMAEETT